MSLSHFLPTMTSQNLGYVDLQDYADEEINNRQKSDRGEDLTYKTEKPRSKPQNSNSASLNDSNSEFEAESTNTLVSAGSPTGSMVAETSVLSTPRRIRRTRARTLTESSILSSSSVVTNGSTISNGSSSSSASGTPPIPAPMTPSNKRKSYVVETDDFMSLNNSLSGSFSSSSSTATRTRHRSHSTAALTSNDHSNSSSYISAGPSMRSSVSYNSNLSSHIMMTPQSQKNNLNNSASLNPIAPSSGVNPFYTPPTFLTPSRRISTHELEERNNDHKTNQKRLSIISNRDNNNNRDIALLPKVNRDKANNNKNDNFKNNNEASDNSDCEAKNSNNRSNISKDSDIDSDDEASTIVSGHGLQFDRSRSSTNTSLNAYNSFTSQSHIQHLFATPVSRGEAYGHLNGNSVVSSIASQPAMPNPNITSLMPVFLGTPGMVISPHSGMLQSRTMDIFDENSNNSLGSPHRYRGNPVLYSHSHSHLHNSRHSQLLKQAQYNQQFTTNIDDENDDMWTSKTKQQSAAHIALKIANGGLPTSNSAASPSKTPGGNGLSTSDMNSRLSMSINNGTNITGNFGTPLIQSSPSKNSLSSSPFSKYIHSNFIKESPRPPKSGGNGFLGTPTSYQDNGFHQGSSLLDDPFEEDHHNPRNFSHLSKPHHPTDQPFQTPTVLTEDFRVPLLDVSTIGIHHQSQESVSSKGYNNQSSVYRSPVRSYSHHISSEFRRSVSKEKDPIQALHSQLQSQDKLQRHSQGQLQRRNEDENHHVSSSVTNTPSRTMSQSSSSSSLSLERLDIETPPLFAPVLDAIKHIDKPHKCPHCSKRFKRMEHVRRHAKTHTAEKPFTCDVEDCGRKFSRRDNLRAHLKTHTKKGGRNSFVEGLTL
ncbi:hypothetical protein NADFUDRAFT_67250 [Nadsonia fulvescens var. elongata DSM 6958]|uniref:C2H2-type domain-containing protein n=1 Tax=Nadsonia fulvescens var. elongata DSM 6958 TaxID=857566 RepID=A0A1E3PEP3_9ASCO|nr:hypothetical protein NADFUDRAFT_67250 [Nadsonia fulvescens var. elongata DSM 6958]